jgi:hypothetical protein
MNGEVGWYRVGLTAPTPTASRTALKTPPGMPGGLAMNEKPTLWFSAGAGGSFGRGTPTDGIQVEHATAGLATTAPVLRKPS